MQPPVKKVKNGGRKEEAGQKGDGIQLVKVDSRLVLLVIINIVDNAMKYTPSGGTIFISTKREDTNVHIRIADNGIGIPANKPKGTVFDFTLPVEEVHIHE